MKKNVITILIDSVFADCISKSKIIAGATPFIDSLAKDSLVATNIYSYGPYTDAATIGLYNAIPTLSSFGYYYGINSSEYNHFKVFKENGYKTIGLFYPYYLLSSKVRKDIDYPVYTSGFKYQSVWFGKLEYYAPKALKGELSASEYERIEKCMDMVFECWKGYYDDITKKNFSNLIAKDLYPNQTIEDCQQKLEYQYKLFQKNKKEYIYSLLKEGSNHELAKIDNYSFLNNSSSLFLKNIYKTHKKFFKRAVRINIKRNLTNNFPSLKKSLKCLYSFLRDHKKNHLRYFGNYLLLLLQFNIMKKQSIKNRNWQVLASFNKQVETLIDVIDQNKKDESIPFYASLHVLEPHHSISCFSFDSNDPETIKKELEYLEPLIDGCQKDFKGSLLYLMSLRYVDYCIKKLFSELKKRDLLDKTIIMLTSDHGSSYFFDPIRTHVINTFHRENYNVPLLIYGKSLPATVKGAFSGFYMSEDILPTLFSIAGVDYPKELKGRVIYMDNSEREYVITEYMGPGVPDMLEREVWTSIRNKKYVIGYKCLLREELRETQPVVFYDLSRDPSERNNLSSLFSSVRNTEVDDLISILDKRFNEIKNETFDIMSHFDEFIVC